jgi:class 3 adenylate cyclase/tetratricopeptide (TPR) repeat protein
MAVGRTDRPPRVSWLVGEILSTAPSPWEQDVTICPSCGQHNPAAARFCLACGTRLVAEGAASREVRKMVTVVFSDVASSIALGERLDPESLRRAMGRYFDEMSAVIERHGGTVEKFIGDAIMAVFGIPTVHEDDALRAVAATVEMRKQLERLNRELERDVGIRIEIRLGANTGEVVAGDPATGQRLVTGDAVNVAKRLEQAAGSGEILIGRETQRLVRDAVRVEEIAALEIKGKEKQVPAFRVLELLSGAPGHMRRLGSPMIGREDERTLLERAFERAVRERSCHLFTILGAAGVGKSRLVAEVVANLSDRATIVSGHCLPYGEGITFWPVAEVVRHLVDVQSARDIERVVEDDADAELIADRVAGAIGLADGVGSAEETFWAVRKLLERQARMRPLVVVFDDVHWAEPTFLDLVEHVADWSRDAPMLVVCGARPELLDHRPNWGGGKLNAMSILLEPLTDSESDRLIENLLGRASLADEARARIKEAAEGNPLFVEEMLSMLIDDGLLRRENGGWRPTADLADISMPSTIQALLAARLDRLEHDERAIIDRAAVEGKVFHVGAVSELAPDRLRGAVDAHLMTLVRKELIRPTRPELPGEEAFSFRHLLLRDAAYEALPKQVRAELHERYADWLARAVREHAFEYEEILGYHLEQAHRSRADLGPLDQNAEGLGRHAAECLAAAGRRALARGDAHAATNLLERALVLVPSTDPVGLEVALDLTDAFILAGKFERAEQVATAAIEAGGDSRHGLLALLLRSDVRTFTEPEGSFEHLRNVAECALPELEKARDNKGLARAWAAIAWTHHIAMRFEAAIDARERAFLHARRAGDERQANEALIQIGIDLIYGPTPAEDAIRRCKAVLEDTSISRWGEMGFMDALAVHEAMLGHFDAARELVERVRAMTEDLGLARGLPFILRAEHAWIVETLAGDAAAAEREIRIAYEVLEQMGGKGLLSTRAARLAQSLYAQERYEEAEHYTEISEQAGASDDIVTQLLWRQVRAKVLARRGYAEDAEKLAYDAVALAEPTDALDMRADAISDLAEVLRLVGRTDETKGVLEDAIRLYEQKGDVVSATRARDALAGAVRT